MRKLESLFRKIATGFTKFDVLLEGLVLEFLLIFGRWGCLV